MLKKIRNLNNIAKLTLSVVFIIALSLILYNSVTSTRPILFCYILTIGIITSLASFYTFGWFELSHKNLFNQPLFWISIFTPLYLFLSIGLWSWQGHSINFTSNGFNNFLTISKLPLLFLASSVPLTSIVNNIHRTIQTEKQITETEKKNISDSYFTHFKYTTELFDSIQSPNIDWMFDIKQGFGVQRGSFESTTLNIKSPIRLYKKIFHHSNAFDGGNYNVNNEYIERIKQHWANINSQLEILFASKNTYEYSDKINDKVNAIKSINDDYITICDLLFIKGYNAGKSFNFEEQYGHFEMILTFANESNFYQCLNALDSMTTAIFETISVATTGEDLNLEKNHFNYKLKAFDEWKPYFMVKKIINEHQPPAIFKKNLA